MLDSQNCLQNCFKNAITTKFLSELAFYTSKERTCTFLSFYDFWFTFNNKFCSPYPIVDFLRIFNDQNRKPLTLSRDLDCQCFRLIRNKLFGPPSRHHAFPLGIDHSKAGSTNCISDIPDGRHFYGVIRRNRKHFCSLVLKSLVFTDCNCRQS